jgi:hypothetical protein
MAKSTAPFSSKASQRRLAASVKSMGNVKAVVGGPTSNIAQARKLQAQKNNINATYGRNRFQVGAGVLNQAVGAGGLTKAGKVSKAQVKAARQTAKNILGSKEGGSKGSKGKKKR